MKKIEIEIPYGKRAEWVNGVLTLVDDTPKDIRDRIKTFEDALEALGDEHPLVKEYWGVVNVDLDITQDLIAYLKLRIITAALNEGWESTFAEGELRRYPWFIIKQDDLMCASANYAGSHSSSSYGVRLAFKSKELAEYAGKQFIDIYKDFCFKTLTKNDEQDIQAPSNL